MWARRRAAPATLLALTSVAGCATADLIAPEPLPSGADIGALHVVETHLVGQLTGPGSLNRTDVRWDVHGTDLGHTFWHDGALWMVFGDTFGRGGLGGENWRSNTMARLADGDPADGLRFASMITGPDGTARELIPSLKVAGEEKTVIPTAGLSVGGRMFLHYMSVKRWAGGSGQWQVGHSGLAYSDDDGQSWTVPENARQRAGMGFEQLAFVEREGRTYMFGVEGGRFSGVQLRRVRSERLLDPASYEYWDGGAWIARPEAAVTVVPSPVGELSVAWNAARGQWMMTYLNPDRRAIVLRVASDLTGPWSEELVIVTAEEYPGLYAPYIVPLPDIGDDVYFTMSMWRPYNVFLMRFRLASSPQTLVAANR